MQDLTVETSQPSITASTPIRSVTERAERAKRAHERGFTYVVRTEEVEYHSSDSEEETIVSDS